MIFRDSLVQGIIGAGDIRECFRTIDWLLSSGKGCGADGECRVKVRILLVYESQKELHEVHTEWLGWKNEEQGP